MRRGRRQRRRGEPSRPARRPLGVLPRRPASAASATRNEHRRRGRREAGALPAMARGVAAESACGRRTGSGPSGSCIAGSSFAGRRRRGGNGAARRTRGCAARLAASSPPAGLAVFIPACRAQCWISPRQPPGKGRCRNRTRRRLVPRCLGVLACFRGHRYARRPGASLFCAGEGVRRPDRAVRRCRCVGASNAAPGIAAPQPLVSWSHPPLAELRQLTSGAAGRGAVATRTPTLALIATPRAPDAETPRSNQDAGASRARQRPWRLCRGRVNARGSASSDGG